MLLTHSCDLNSNFTQNGPFTRPGHTVQFMRTNTFKRAGSPINATWGFNSDDLDILPLHTTWTLIFNRSDQVQTSWMYSKRSGLNTPLHTNWT
ncbi:hypothetical protein HanIR_Chr11g0512621 [Helianthus annuus]|nr:hypothetical protein HanIR_Chr11g0512621 [Helianthus annuus]